MKYFVPICTITVLTDKTKHVGVVHLSGLQAINMHTYSDAIYVAWKVLKAPSFSYRTLSL